MASYSDFVTNTRLDFEVRIFFIMQIICIHESGLYSFRESVHFLVLFQTECLMSFHVSMASTIPQSVIYFNLHKQ